MVMIAVLLKLGCPCCRRDCFAIEPSVTMGMFRTGKKLECKHVPNMAASENKHTNAGRVCLAPSVNVLLLPCREMLISFGISKHVCEFAVVSTPLLSVIVHLLTTRSVSKQAAFRV